jgi:VIT1/CCC1 family predicted Fe2+/Mn2+ transporter
MAKSDFWKTRLNKWSFIDKPSRISEILFGLIMVLTFTCTISVTSDGKQEIKELLWAALGCNLAWGLVDGIMNLSNEIISRMHSGMQLKRIKKAQNLTESREIIKENISPLLADLMQKEEIDNLSKRLKKLPELTLPKSIVFKDVLIALQIFLLVFLITFPVALPFVFINNVAMAMRISNGVAIILLFAGGFSLARYSGLRPVITGLAYAIGGILIVAFTMALGG